MKMRFWQKTYIFTLVLFLICLNVGILSLTVYTYQKNVASTETAVTAEQYYVAMSFERDYKEMTESNSNSSPSLLMQSFGTYYANKGLFLAFEENGEVIYSNFTNEYGIDKNALLHTDFDGKRHIVISSEICDGKYEMIFAKDVESLDSEFQALMLTYALTAIGVSLLLAVCLYFILKTLSGPLEKLRKTTEVIEAGDFSVTAEEKGSDEFTLLAKSFNAMLAKINEQMAALEREAERKQMLVDNMAHELRTPLTSIHGYAEYIEKANTTEERRLIAAKYIMSESERLQKISEILLDGAFIRENEIEMADTHLDAVLADVAEKLRKFVASSDSKDEDSFKSEILYAYIAAVRNDVSGETYKAVRCRDIASYLADSRCPASVESACEICRRGSAYTLHSTACRCVIGACAKVAEHTHRPGKVTSHSFGILMVKLL